MSGQTSPPVVRALPDHPSLEHLKKQARRRLRELQAVSPGRRLADAQLQIARGYGFASWRAMKAFVERNGGRGGMSNRTGFYRHDPRIAVNGLIAITAQDGRLFLEAVTGARFELTEAGAGRFAIAGVEGSYSFEEAEAGPAAALVSHLPGGDVRLERIDTAEARAILAARERALADQRRPRTQVAIAPEALQRCVGHYVSRAGPGLEVVCKDGRMLVQIVGQPQLEVFPESETRFFYRGLPAQLEFVLEDGRAAAVVIHQNGLEQRFGRVSAEEALRSTARIREAQSEQERPRALAKIDPVVLDRYAGRYRLDPSRIATVTAEDGRLFVQLTDQPRIEVHPESEQTFFWTVVAAQITFVTAPGGRVTHAVLHQSGRNVPMPRIDQGAAA